MKYVLYGGGTNGIDAYNCFEQNGKAHLLKGIIDNNPALTYSIAWRDIQVLPYSEAKSFLDEKTTVIITPSIATSIEIGAQLRSDGYIRFIYWTLEKDTPFSEVLQILESEDNTILARTLSQEVALYKHQAGFLIEHTDPKHLLGAKGELRKTQLEIAELTGLFFKEMEKIGVKPFLTAGNLLGLIRHNGFIPWDDDMDVAVTRTDYDVIVEYYKSKGRFSKYEGRLNNREYQRWCESFADKHKNEVVVIEIPFILKVFLKKLNGSLAFVDIFPMDEYKSEYSFEEYKSFMSGYTKKAMFCRDTNDLSLLIKEIKENDRNNQEPGGGNFCYGNETWTALFAFQRKQRFLSSAELFPLRNACYEGANVYIPNKPEALIQYEFGSNYMSVPKDATWNHFDL